MLKVPITAPRAYLKANTGVQSGSHRYRERLKLGGTVSAWDHFAIVTRIRDAYDILGDIQQSDEIMRLASDVGADGVFAVNRLGRLQVYEQVVGRHGQDKAFSFALLDPNLLQQSANVPLLKGRQVFSIMCQRCS